MSERFEIRADLFPLVLMTARQVLTASDADEVYDQFRAFLRRRSKFVTVTDVRAVNEMPDALTRKRLGEGSARFMADAKPYALGSAIVLESAIVRGALTAIQWISRPEQPSVYFGTLRPAVDWAIQKLEAAGVAITPAILAFRDAAA
jgi:hypothetical protein